MEELMKNEGHPVGETDLDTMDLYWEKAKIIQRS